MEGPSLLSRRESSLKGPSRHPKPLTEVGESERETPAAAVQLPVQEPSEEQSARLHATLTVDGRQTDSATVVGPPNGHGEWANSAVAGAVDEHLAALDQLVIGSPDRVQRKAEFGRNLAQRRHARCCARHRLARCEQPTECGARGEN